MAQNTDREKLASLKAPVNYITEINEFYSKMLLNPLPPNAQALWFAMMHCWNSAYWRLPLSLSESRLRGLSGLSHDQFIKARKLLTTHGYIKHLPQKGNKAPLYYMYILSMQRAIEQGL